MPIEMPRAILEVHYEAAAREYLRKLKPENHMEATPQATQRAITLASLALVHERRPEVQFFNELLVQYPPTGRHRKPGQVVPDNMVVVHREPIRAGLHFSLPLQPVAPFWVMEYISEYSERKDYVANLRMYEEDLRIAYYLRFHTDDLKLSMLRHNGTRYVTVPPDERGLYAVPELEMAVSLSGGAVRYWYRDEMMLLPGEMLRRIEELKRETERLRAEQADRERQVSANARAEAS